MTRIVSQAEPGVSGRPAAPIVPQSNEDKTEGAFSTFNLVSSLLFADVPFRSQSTPPSTISLNLLPSPLHPPTRLCWAISDGPVPRATRSDRKRSATDRVLESKRKLRLMRRSRVSLSPLPSHSLVVVTS